MESENNSEYSLSDKQKQAIQEARSEIVNGVFTDGGVNKESEEWLKM
ncbi:MAG TPA: hypothetical protein VK084_09645 [Chitinophagaceae bacterium]|nr:hypothetical protein [Chitinophagaceae bacterium]